MGTRKQSNSRDSKKKISLQDIDYERVALEYTFSKLLSEYQRDVVLYKIETRFSNRLKIVVPLTRAEILNVLEGLFGTGAHVLIREFDRKMNELKQYRIDARHP